LAVDKRQYHGGHKMLDMEDGYTVTKIRVPHLGEDYGKVQVWYQNGEVSEFEVNRKLAESLKQYLERAA
jgi:hypothetical protein